MLYDPRRDKQTKTDPFSLESLIAWLEKQPDDVSYEYTCAGRCLLALYFTAMGFRKVTMMPDQFVHDKPMKEEKLPALFNDIAIGRVNMFQNRDRTFGGALERARACLRT